MNKSTAVVSMLLIILVIANFFIPGSSGEASYLAIGVQAAYFGAKENVDYSAVRSSVDTPATLPFNAVFSEKYDKRDFSCDISASVESGYYSRAQQIFFFSDYDLYYTTDGTLPDKSSLKYDKQSGIDVSDNTFLCVCAEKNGKFSDVCFFSYVIMKDATDFHFAYGYNSLNPYDRFIYELIYDKISKFEREIVLGNRNLTNSKVQKILRCINYDNPLLFQTPLVALNWSGSPKNVTKIALAYDFDKEKCEEYRKNTELYVDNILKEADGAFSLVEYLDIVRYNILENAEYDYNEYIADSSYEAFGVLLKKCGVCESYSRAFQYVCQRIGVDCILAVGQSGGEGHMWNMLCLDDDWYHMDLTWDDGDDGEVYYDFFNINDKTLAQYGERTIDPVMDDTKITRDIMSDYNPYPIPAANGEIYSYYNYVIGYDSY